MVKGRDLSGSRVKPEGNLTMTSITQPCRLRPSQRSRLFAQRVIRRVLNGWHQWEAERAIEAMPTDLRKDIGWPTTDMHPAARAQR